MSKVTSNPTSKTRKKRKAPKKTQVKSPKPAELKQYPNLQDTFHSEEQEQERIHLIQEHEARLQATEDLHQQRLKTIRDQLHLQLFKMWNEVWLQRKKIYDQSFREWLKLLSS